MRFFILRLNVSHRIIVNVGSLYLNTCTYIAKRFFGVFKILKELVVIENLKYLYKIVAAYFWQSKDRQGA